MELSPKDKEKLEFVLQKIKEGTATTYDKPTAEAYLEGVLRPRCAICRGIIESDLVVINNRKMHAKCSKKYKG